MSKNLRGVVDPLSRALIASLRLGLASFVLLAQVLLRTLLGLFGLACIVLKRPEIPDGLSVWGESFAAGGGIWVCSVRMT